MGSREATVRSFLTVAVDGDPTNANTMGPMISDKLLWRVYAGVAGALTTFVAQKVVTGVWTLVTGDETPPESSDPDVPAVKAFSWALASGIGIAGSQLLINRAIRSHQLRAHTQSTQ